MEDSQDKAALEPFEEGPDDKLTESMDSVKEAGVRPPGGEVRPEPVPNNRTVQKPEWPVDRFGRTRELKNAIMGLGDVRSEEVQEIIEECMKTGYMWFTARCDSNREAQKVKAKARAERLRKQAVERAENEVVGARKKFEDLVQAARSARDVVEKAEAILKEHGVDVPKEDEKKDA